MELNIEIKDIMSHTSEFYSLSKDRITLGRKASHEIAINNKYISDTHASIIMENERIYIKDEKSSNGTEIYTNNRWNTLDSRKQEVTLPVQIKLAEAVVVMIQSGESQMLSLSEVENNVAIMVLDLCDSTNQALDNEQIAFHLKQRLNNIAKPILYAAPINFYKNTGDGFLATFPKTSQAVNCAIKILKILEKRNKSSKNPPINVRIGLHKGVTYVIDPSTEDIHGIDVNITFRIEGLTKRAIRRTKAHIGEKNRILASKFFYTDYMKRAGRKKDLFELCGSARLKGIKDKIEIYRINWK
ncbi:MAG: FHA domain-containing protein [Spirochaetaceae bacterium]|nr:FHA domain-containing protein [Spirochaetaceae bacterium]